MEQLGIGMVSQFPIDYMHAVLLGVTRKLLILWKNGDTSKKVSTKFRLSDKMFEQISTRLVATRITCPSEFHRKPRSLEEMLNFKATELRTFLCYTGFIGLKGILSREIYENFLLLACAMRILLQDSELSSRRCMHAKQLLRQFVEGFIEIYGKKHVTYNVHVLIHLADEAERFGSLDNISAFPFESHLFVLKKLIKTPNRQLQQIVHRILERRQICQIGPADAVNPKPQFKKMHCRGPLPICCLNLSTEQYGCVLIAGKRFSISSRDRFVRCGSDVCVIDNILKSKNGEALLVIRKFSEKKCYFDKPLRSTEFGVCLVSKLKAGHHLCKLKDCQKVWLQKQKQGFVCVEMMSIEK